MYKLFIIPLIVFSSCISKEDNCKNNTAISTECPQYFINDSLNGDFYKNLDSHIPEEGLVPNADIATKIAQTILVHVYGKEIIKGQEPFSVNLQDDIWYIEGNLKIPDDVIVMGGVFYIEISKKDCQVLKFIHTK